MSQGKSRPSPAQIALVLAALVALAALPYVQAQGTSPFKADICVNHDFDSATTTWVLLDQDWKAGTDRIKTTGSSATVTAVSGSPFASITSVPGALIRVQPSNASTAWDERYVLTKASSTSIGVDTAATWTASSGHAWEYRNYRSTGTAAGSGWFDLDGVRSAVLTFQIEQLSVASGSVEVFIETRPSSPWAAGTQIYPPTGGTGQCGTGAFTTAGATARCEVAFHDNASRKVRFGVRLTDEGGDTGANVERISAWVTGYR